MDLNPLRRSDTGRETEHVRMVIALGADLQIGVAEFSARQNGTHYTETRITALDSDGNPLSTLAVSLGVGIAGEALTAAIATAIRTYPNHV